MRLKKWLCGEEGEAKATQSLGHLEINCVLVVASRAKKGKVKTREEL